MNKEVELFKTKSLKQILSGFTKAAGVSEIGAPPLASPLVESFVYVLFKDGKPVYFGASKHDKKRIAAHKDKDFDSAMFYYSAKAFELEKTLIQRFKTVYNKCLTAFTSHTFQCRFCFNTFEKTEKHYIMDVTGYTDENGEPDCEAVYTLCKCDKINHLGVNTCCKSCKQ